MSEVLLYFLLTAGLFLAVILLPRVRFIGDIGPARKSIKIRNLWFRAEIDLRRKITSLKILFFRIYSSKETNLERQKSGSGQSLRDRDDNLAMDCSFTESALADAEESSGSEKDSQHKKSRRTLASIFRKLRKKEIKASEERSPKELIWQEKKLLIVLAGKLIHGMNRLFRTVRLDRIWAELDIATPDPALTGILSGAAWQLTALANPPRREIIVRTDFNSTTPRGILNVALSVSPIVVISESMYILIRLPWWRMLGVYRKWRRARKQV